MSTPPKHKRNPLAVGIFNAPIVRLKPSLASLLMHGDAEYQSRIRVSNVEYIKLLSLLPVFRIAIDDEDRWRKLSLRLAQTYIPGFRVVTEPAKRGRRRLDKWEGLVQRVDSLRRKNNLDVKGACAQLARSEGAKAATLRSRYYEQKRATKS